MSSSYLGSSFYGFNVKENVSSIIAWINIYNIVLGILVMSYIVFFLVPTLTGFFISSSSQVFSMPFVAWHLPTMIAVTLGFIFSQDANESFALPLVVINLIGFVCYFICAIICLNAMTTCVQSTTVSCGVVDIFALTIGLILFIVGAYVELLQIFAYVKYSVYVSYLVDGIRKTAKAQQEQQQKEEEEATANAQDEEIELGGSEQNNESKSRYTKFSLDLNDGTFKPKRTKTQKKN